MSICLSLSLSLSSLSLSLSPFRLGYITSEEYMSFLISRETDNVQTMAEIEDAFAAISGEREKLYVTREELLQVT